MLQALGKRSSPDDDLDAALEGEDPGFDEDLSLDDDDDDADDEDYAGERPGEPAGPTNVALPNGETVTAADPNSPL